MARPSKLTSELIEEMKNLLVEGAPIKYVCDYCGITTMSHSNYMTKGEEDYNNNIDSLFSTYFYTIKKAQSTYVIEAGREIRKGEAGWQGKAWWLERTRQDFMPKQQIQADDEGKVTVVIGGKQKPNNK